MSRRTKCEECQKADRYTCLKERETVVPNHDTRVSYVQVCVGDAGETFVYYYPVVAWKVWVHGDDTRVFPITIIDDSVTNAVAFVRLADGSYHDFQFDAVCCNEAEAVEYAVGHIQKRRAKC